MTLPLILSGAEARVPRVPTNGSLTGSASSAPPSRELSGNIANLLPSCQSMLYPSSISIVATDEVMSTSIGEKVESHDKYHMGTFSRLREKRSSSRPGTSDGTVRHPVEKEKTKRKDDLSKERDRKDRTVSLSPSKERDPALLRKRTSSTSDHPSRAPLAAAVVAGAPNLKAGQSILEQIGTPDHNGWMRKKGDRYNAWKLRYFVLKGPHLYWLRSNNKSVGVTLPHRRRSCADLWMRLGHVGDEDQGLPQHRGLQGLGR